MLSTIVRIGLALLLLPILSSLPASAQTVGVAATVRPAAFVERAGERYRLTARDPVQNGDVILTGKTGTVQLAFRDRTRIAIGPNTRFEIDDVALNRDGRARRFAVSLIGGVFRFFSGESPKPSYRLNTPTATMGIRGTTFDVAVDSRRRTRLVTFDGQVRLCSRWGRCAVVLGGCAMAKVGRLGRVGPPEDRNERDATLNTLFPFVTGDQGRLGSAFGTSTDSCGDINPLLVLATPPAPSPLSAAIRPSRQSADSERRSGSTGGGPDEGESH